MSEERGLFYSEIARRNDRLSGVSEMAMLCRFEPSAPISALSTSSEARKETARSRPSKGSFVLCERRILRSEHDASYHLVIRSRRETGPSKLALYAEN